MIVTVSTLIRRRLRRIADIANTTERIRAAKAMIEETASLEKNAHKYSNIKTPPFKAIIAHGKEKENNPRHINIQEKVMNEPTYRFEISKEAKPITNDQICRALLGKSLKAFAKEIQINAGGKYDEFYKKR